ncbi:hypothetical protein MPER_02382, partial [Moniliophthora perniciosa FA553]
MVNVLVVVQQSPDSAAETVSDCECIANFAYFTDIKTSRFIISRPRTLRELGYRIQLGHPPGEECDSPVSGHKDFVVLAWNGIHVVDLDFCGCPDAPAAWNR